jgi:predicted ATPase
MTIKKIKVSNFKSFKNLEVDLDKLNVFIGANAAGKSGFVQIFDFLRNIYRHGLDNAVSMNGGVEYLRNINIGNSEPLLFEIIVDNPRRSRIKNESREGTYREAYETRYNFSLNFNKTFEITGDELRIKSRYYKDDGQEIGEVTLKLFNDNGKIELTTEENSLDFAIDNRIIPPYLKEMRLMEKQLILETPYTFLIEPALNEILKGISIYNINPTLSKRATPITGKSELEEDGRNLAIVLKNIIEDPEKERKFTNLIKDILPFVNKMDVEKFADKSLLFKLKETYVQDVYIPASLLSDGTINITALIIALYFETKKVAIIEEPERNIHPYLISRIVEMFSDASEKKQLLITTHNPEVVKYIDLKKLFLVHRDENGFSKITKPIEKEEIKVFLENEMGIDDLYIQNLLEV